MNSLPHGSQTCGPPNCRSPPRWSSRPPTRTGGRARGTCYSRSTTTRAFTRISVGAQGARDHRQPRCVARLSLVRDPSPGRRVRPGRAGDARRGRGVLPHPATRCAAQRLGEPAVRGHSVAGLAGRAPGRSRAPLSGRDPAAGLLGWVPRRTGRPSSSGRAGNRLHDRLRYRRARTTAGHRAALALTETRGRDPGSVTPACGRRHAHCASRGRSATCSPARPSRSSARRSPRSPYRCRSTPSRTRRSRSAWSALPRWCRSSCSGCTAVRSPTPSTGARCCSTPRSVLA